MASSARSEAMALLSEFGSASCASVRLTRSICDAGPANNLRCENGQCVADQRSCLVAPDAAVDKATTDTPVDGISLADSAADVEADSRGDESDAL